jgi:hypothetical protein
MNIGTTETAWIFQKSESRKGKVPILTTGPATARHRPPAPSPWQSTGYGFNAAQPRLCRGSNPTN